MEFNMSMFGGLFSRENKRVDEVLVDSIETVQLTKKVEFDANARGMVSELLDSADAFNDKDKRNHANKAIKIKLENAINLAKAASTSTPATVLVTEKIFNSASHEAKGTPSR